MCNSPQLAFSGRFVFTALNDSIESSDALANPMDARITLANDLFAFPHLDNAITDTHFQQRDRMGRCVWFGSDPLVVVGAGCSGTGLHRVDVVSWRCVLVCRSLLSPHTTPPHHHTTLPPQGSLRS